MYEIGVIFGVTETTVQDGLNRWEGRGRGGLEDELRDGAPPKLNPNYSSTSGKKRKPSRDLPHLTVGNWLCI